MAKFHAMEISDLLEYRPDGSLVWRLRTLAHMQKEDRLRAWNNTYAGKVAGVHVKGSGKRHCIIVCVFYKKHLAHRLVWELHNGPVPNGALIDHINGDPWDNRIENLRLADKSTNGMNRGANRNNTVGFKGVHFQAGKYAACITVNRKSIYLGRFTTAEEAGAAYAQAAKVHHGEYART